MKGLACLKRGFLLGACLTLLGPTGFAEPVIDVEIEVDFGKDLGQNFGTLFEARDESGRLAFGAGFPAVYNTHYRSERYKFEFFIRPKEGGDSFRLEPFPRPTDIASTYVYDFGGDLFVNYRGAPEGLRKYDRTSKSWIAAADEDHHGISVSTVRGKLLASQGGKVVYGDETIFESPAHPIYRYFYYGKGHLYFYREIKPEGGESQKAVVAIPWTPYDDPIQADIKKEKVLEIFMPPEFPYAWGQFGDEVITCSNWGGLYAFNGSDWKIVRKPQEGVSYQVYSMVTYNDRLLLGQYPTGFTFEYDGAESKVLENWPPVPAGASPSARELQTNAIYRGELYAGVWPWAELWRMNPETEEWIEMGRLFKHPEYHKNPVHPYEEAAKAAEIVGNQLGQRLTSMVMYGDSLIMGTSWKGGDTPIDREKVKDLTDEQVAEFGAIHRLTVPGHLTGVLSWKDGPTKLRFVAGDGKMTILQDGEPIATTKIDDEFLNGLSGADIKWGEGTFGRTSGTVKPAQP